MICSTVDYSINMRTDFFLVLHEDQRTKLGLLNKLEIAFDDSRNRLPESYYELVEKIPFGSVIRIRMEVVE